MLFLYRPPQTWMPYALPRNRMEQAEYNLELQRRFESTQRVAPPAPARDPVEQLKDLAQLRESGAISDAEFDALKAKVLAGGEAS